MPRTISLIVLLLLAALCQPAFATCPGSSNCGIPGGLTWDYYVGDTGGDAGETTLTVGNYDVMNLSLTETFDANGSFTTAANEVCYTGTPTIRVQLLAPISFDRTTGAATDVITVAFGKDTTGAIDDGDEFGDEFMRSVATNQVGMGAIAATTTLATNECISILAQTDDDTGGAGWTMEAASLQIIEMK